MSDILSADGAMDALMDVEEDVIEDGADAEEQDTDEAEDIQAESDDVDGPEEATGDEDEGEEAEPEAVIEPPKFLDATEREAFSSLPTEAKQILQRQSQLVDRHFTTKSQEIAHKSKVLDAQLQQLGQVQSEREARLREWDEVDWQALSQQDPTAYVQHRAQYDAELQEYQQFQNQQAQAVSARQKQHADEVKQQLQTVFPEALDPNKGRAMLTELQTELTRHGVTSERINGLSAIEIRLLYNGMRFEQAQANKPNLRPKSDAKTNAKPLKARGRASSSKRASKSDKFKRAPSRKNAMDALMDID